MHPVLQSGPSICSEPPIERETEASVRSAPGVLFHFTDATRPPPAWAAQACDLPHIHIHPFSSASPSPRGLTAADWATSTCFILWSCFLRKTTTGFARSWRLNFLSGTWIFALWVQLWLGPQDHQPKHGHWSHRRGGIWTSPLGHASCSLELDCIFLDVQFLVSSPSLCLE